MLSSVKSIPSVVVVGACFRHDAQAGPVAPVVSTPVQPGILHAEQIWIPIGLLRMQLRALFEVDRRERAALLIAFIYFFGLLSSYYMLRSVREAMGVRIGPEYYSWLYTGSFLCMLLAQPLYGALVSRYARRVFVPVVYGFFLACVLGFFVIWQVPAWRDGMALVFYIWLSVANLFTVSVFWSYMTDVFDQHQAKRVFGFIAAGGSAGGLTGAGLTMLLAGRIDIDGVLAISFLFLALSCACSVVLGRFARSASARIDAEAMDQLIGGTSFAAFRLIVREIPLRWLGLLMLLSGVGGGILYQQQGFVVRALFENDGLRAAYFARIDLLTNLLALLLEVFLARWLFLRLGTARLMTLMPLMLMAGLGSLVLLPTAFMIGLFQILSRGVRFAFGEPAIASCYTTLDREIRYKGKGFIDTFVYRLSDVATQWSIKGLTFLGMGSGGLFAWGAVMAALTAWSALIAGRQHEARIRNG
jgi:ATP:ADP antiporter, AAA family